MYNAEELIDAICNAEYQYKSYDGKLDTDKVVSRYSSDATAKRAAIAGAVYTWLGNQQSDIEKDRSIGELEAKCFTYEKIIANSNFSPMLEKDKKDESDLSKIIVNTTTNEIIAVTSKHDELVKDGYTIVTTHVDNNLIYKDANGSIRLEIGTVESEGINESN